MVRARASIDAFALVDTSEPSVFLFVYDGSSFRRAVSLFAPGARLCCLRHRPTRVDLRSGAILGPDSCLHIADRRVCSPRRRTWVCTLRVRSWRLRGHCVFYADRRVFDHRQSVCSPFSAVHSFMRRRYTDRSSTSRYETSLHSVDRRWLAGLQRRAPAALDG